MSVDVPPLGAGRRLAVFRRVVSGADRRLVAVVVSLFAMDTVAGTTTALALKWLIDGATEGREGAALVAAGVAALAAGVTAVVGRVLTDLEIVLANQTGYDVDRETLAVTSATPGIDHLERGDYLDRIALVRGHGGDLFRAVYSVGRGASLGLRFLLGVVVLGTVHPVFAVLPIFAVPAVALVGRTNRITAQGAARSAELLRASSQVHGLFLDLGPAMELRVFDCQDALDRRADELWRDLSTTKARAALRAAALAVAGWVVMAAGYASALVLVVVLVADGAATVGDIVLVAQISLQLRSNLNEAVASLRQAAAATTTADRFGWLEDVTAEQTAQMGGTVAAPERLSEGILLDGVGFTYPGAAHPALHDVDLVLPAGATVAVVGPNGAGKTTLVKLLARLHLPTEGNVTVDGRDLADITAESWAARTSATFQDFVHLEAEVRDTVGVAAGREASDEDLLEALARAEAAEMVSRWPDGLSTQVGRSYAEGRELSGGQWQRLAIARALARPQPLLLLLDEPTSAIDPAAEHALVESYGQAARRIAAAGGITVVISHRMTSVRLADVIVVVDDGTVLEWGSHDDLCGRDGSYAEMVRLQRAAYR